MKKLFTLLFLFSIISVGWSQDYTVETVGATGFNPTNLTVFQGETVEWVNTGGSHNVNGTQTTYPNNPESFGNAVSAGWTFQHTFNTKGFYNYQCDPHVGLGMVGTVTVLGPQYPIGLVTGDSDGNGETDSLGVECSLTGVVYGIDLRGGDGIQFTIIDSNNDGIQIFSFDDVSGYVVNEGDEITVDGTVSSFNGLAQFNPDTIIVNSMGNTLFAATDVTVLDESTESQLIRLSNVSLVDPSQWDNSGSNNIDVTDGTNNYVVRLDSDVDLNNEPAPTGTFNITGIGGQFDNSDPYTEGYQLLPRYVADLETITNPCDIATLTADSDGNGEADSVGVACTITGIVYGVDLRGGTGLQFTLIDNNNDGIQIFSFDDVASYVVTEGDEITVEGAVSSFNGLAQFSPDTIIVNSSGNALVTATDVTALDESTESQLVRLVNVSLADPGQWTGSGSFNVDVTDGTNTYVVRLDSDVDLASAAAPSGLFNLTGIGGQFDSSDPYTDGYQLFPRYTADLELVGGGAPALMIVGVVDPQGGNGSGSNTAGPKAVELYALQDIPDLSVYGVGAANNGGGSDGIEFTFPADAIAAGTCITYTDSVNVDNFTNFFGFSADYLVPAGGTSASGVNGDDAIELFENGVVIDVFGDPNVDGSGEAWEYTDGWAYRKNTIMPNGGTFNADNWIYSGTDALQDNDFTMNSQFANPFPNCTYSPVPLPTYNPATIGAVTADGDGNTLPDSLNSLVEVTGVVYGVDLRGGDGYSFTIIGSDNEGINVFNFGDVDGYVVTEGDEITVRGEIIQFNGLTEIVPDNITLNSQGNALNTADDVTDLNESTESQFIRMVSMTLVDPTQWDLLGGSFNVDITDGTNTFVMRIDSDTDIAGTAAPTGLFNVTGIGGQFDTSDPYDEGYQIFPRYLTDIEEIIATNDLDLGNQIKFHPNPVSDLLQIRSEIQLDQIRISNMLGQQLQVMNRPNTNEFVNVSNWQSGIYAITFISDNRIYTAQFVKK